MKVKCYNKKCLHEWFYTGDNKKFICCPKCRFKRILSKCMLFYTKGHTKNDIQSDRPKDIPTKNSTYKKVVKQKQTDFVVHGKKVKEFENISDFNLATQNKKDPLTITEIPREPSIIREIPRDPLNIIEHQENFF